MHAWVDIILLAYTIGRLMVTECDCHSAVHNMNCEIFDTGKCITECAALVQARPYNVYVNFYQFGGKPPMSSTQSCFLLKFDMQNRNPTEFYLIRFTKLLGKYPLGLLQKHLLPLYVTGLSGYSGLIGLD